MKVTECYADFLEREGFFPHVETDREQRTAVIFFKSEGTEYAVHCDEEDPEFFRMSTLFAFDESMTDEERLLRTANALNIKKKAVKTDVYFKGRSVMFSVQQFVAAPEHIVPVFNRSLGCLRSAAMEFYSGPADD